MSEKAKEKLKLRFKFNETMSEEEGDRILFKVFDILLASQNDKENENNRNTNSANKGE